jgi:hypothetical protein
VVNGHRSPCVAIRRSETKARGSDEEAWKFLIDQQKIVLYVHIENDGQGSTRPLLGGIWLTDNSTFPRSKGAAANGGLDRRKIRRQFIGRGEKVRRGNELEDVLHAPREGTMSSLIPLAPRRYRGDIAAIPDMTYISDEAVVSIGEQSACCSLHHDCWM